MTRGYRRCKVCTREVKPLLALRQRSKCTSPSQALSLTWSLREQTPIRGTRHVASFSRCVVPARADSDPGNTSHHFFLLLPAWPAGWADLGWGRRHGAQLSARWEHPVVAWGWASRVLSERGVGTPCSLVSGAGWPWRPTNLSSDSDKRRGPPTHPRGNKTRQCGSTDHRLSWLKGANFPRDQPWPVWFSG